MSSKDNAHKTPSGRALIGTILVRLVIPLWVLTGAVAKLASQKPSLLPREIYSTAFEKGINLQLLLTVIIALEFFAVAVMFFLPKFARLMAAWMTGVFCAVLINELIAGNFTNCGCLGTISPPPWLMLTIDALLFIGVFVFSPMKSKAKALPPARLGLVAGWTLIGAVLAGVLIMAGTDDPVDSDDPPAVADENDDSETDTSEPTGGDGTAETPQQPPAFAWPRREANYMAVAGSDASVLEGKPWTTLSFLGWIPPKDRPTEATMGSGRHYVILYSKSCDHCAELLEFWFSTEPPVPTIAVAQPEDKDAFDRAGDLGAQCVGCTMVELPLGTYYLDTPPMIFAIEDGIIVCAEMVEDVTEPKCLIWH